MANQSFRFSDELIGQVSKLLQVALLTGTDIIDHLRMLETTQDESGQLVLTDEYKKVFDGQIDTMMKEISEIQAGNVDDN